MADKTQKKKKPQPLNKDDYENIITMIDTAAQRGLIAGSGLTMAGKLYDKVTALMNEQK